MLASEIMSRIAPKISLSERAYLFIGLPNRIVGKIDISGVRNRDIQRTLHIR